MATQAIKNDRNREREKSKRERPGEGEERKGNCYNRAIIKISFLLCYYAIMWERKTRERK